jgi:hypothetical protein
VSSGLDFSRGWAHREVEGVLNPIPTDFDSLNRRFMLDSKGDKYPYSVKIGDKSTDFDSLLRFCMRVMESKAATSRCTQGRCGSGLAMAAWTVGTGDVAAGLGVGIDPGSGKGEPGWDSS